MAKRGVRRRRLPHIIKLTWLGGSVSISPQLVLRSLPAWLPLTLRLWVLWDPGSKRVPPSYSPSDLLNHNQENRGNQSPWEQLISWGYMVTTKTKSCVCGLECHSNCEDACNPEYAEACLRFNGDRLQTPSCVSRKHWYPFLWGLLLLDQDANHADGLRPVPHWLGSGVSSSTNTRCCASLEERSGCLWAPVAPEKMLAPCCQCQPHTQYVTNVTLLSTRHQLDRLIQKELGGSQSKS